MFTSTLKLSLILLCVLLCGNTPDAIALPTQHDGIEIREAWITLPDGTRLAADLYQPVGLTDQTLPVLLEYLPYRKDD